MENNIFCQQKNQETHFYRD